MSRLLPPLLLHLVILAWIAAAEPYKTRFVDNLSFQTYDNFTLHGDAYIPIRPANDTTLFPLIIMPNSWGMPQFEYLLKTLALGEAGYVAVEYETRGWYDSGGIIDVCGPQDIKDATSVLDQVLTHAEAWHINVNKTAFLGISYGAGISLSMAGSDPRLTTAVVMSGWNNLTDAVYQYNTPNLVWGSLLEILGQLLGHESFKLKAIFEDLLAHRNMSFVLDFVAKRSPGRLVEQMNARKIPLLLSNNFLDRLFRPQHMLHFFEQLDLPKMLLLNQGMHAEAEAFGLFDLPHNYVWDKARRWLDYWLKGKDTGIMQLPKIHMQRGGNVLLDQDYVKFQTWPDRQSVQEQRWYMTPRDGFLNHFGGLTPTAPAANSTVVDYITFSVLPTVSSGFVLLADALSTIGVPHTDDMGLTNTKTSLVFLSSALEGSETICGTAKVNLTLVVPAHNNWQITGFLYEVDAIGVGELISDMAYTHYTAEEKGTTSGRHLSLKQVTLKDIMFHSFCRKLKPGRRVAVAFALYSNLYEPANTSDDLRLGFVYPDGGDAPSLMLPFNPR